LTSGLRGPSSFHGKGVIAGRSLGTLQKNKKKKRKGRKMREEKRKLRGKTKGTEVAKGRRLRANTIPKEPGSISEAVTSAKRASFLGNRKLRRPKGKCRQATSRVVFLLFSPRISFFLPSLGYDPLNILSHHSVASFRAIPRISSFCKKELGTIYRENQLHWMECNLFYLLIIINIINYYNLYLLIIIDLFIK